LPTLDQATCLLGKLKVRDLPVHKAAGRDVSPHFCGEQFFGSVTDQHAFSFFSFIFCTGINHN